MNTNRVQSQNIPKAEVIALTRQSRVLNVALPSGEIYTPPPIQAVARASAAHEAILEILNEGGDDPEFIQSQLGNRGISPEARSAGVQHAAEYGYIKVMKWLLTRNENQKIHDRFFSMVTRKPQRSLISEEDFHLAVATAIESEHLEVIALLIEATSYDIQRLADVLDNKSVEQIILKMMETTPQISLHYLIAWKLRLSNENFDAILIRAAELGLSEICEEIPLVATSANETAILLAIIHGHRKLAWDLYNLSKGRVFPKLFPDNIFREAATQGYTELTASILNNPNMFVSNKVSSEAFIAAVKRGHIQVAEIISENRWIPIEDRDQALEIALEHQQDEFIQRLLTPPNLNISQETLVGFSKEERTQLVLQAFRFMDREDVFSSIPNLLQSGPITSKAKEIALISISHFSDNENITFPIIQILTDETDIYLSCFLEILKISIEKKHRKIALSLLEIYSDFKSLRLTQNEMEQIALWTFNDMNKVFLKCLANMRPFYNPDFLLPLFFDMAKQGNLDAVAFLSNLLKGEHQAKRKALFEALENNRTGVVKILEKTTYMSSENLAKAREIIQKNKAVAMLQEIIEETSTISVNQLEIALSRLETSNFSPDVKALAWGVFFSKLDRSLENFVILELFASIHENRVLLLGTQPKENVQEVKTEKTVFSPNYYMIAAAIFIFAVCFFNNLSPVDDTKLTINNSN